jgi:UDP-N-acetylmuramyl pentapeptide phosphotransferase/UDP-N-acetylglucosamine-1-phosphate transferase
MLLAVTVVASLGLGVIFLFAFRNVLQSEGLLRTNYRGLKLPTAAGVIFAPSFLVVWMGSQAYYTANYEEWTRLAVPGHFGLRYGMNMSLILVLGMCLLGLLDDAAGDSSARGFKGHFSEALKGRFTTGFMKSLLGLLVALAALLPPYLSLGSMSASGYGKWILGAAVIALSANLFNLLDRAPGRALKVFFPALAICLALVLRSDTVTYSVPYPSMSSYAVPALSVAMVALVLFPGDLRERFMMGDAGSNVIGAVVGLGLVLGTSFWWRVGVLVLLLAINLLSEKYSFSRIIASNRALNWLDSLGRKGDGPPAANY